MDKYKDAVKYILMEQESIIGPVAQDLVRDVNGLKVDGDRVEISGDPKMVLHEFISQFEHLFGNLSIEVSKKVLRTRGLYFEPSELPEILTR